ncbi:MAG: ABC-F family ATP-binding cassette domain-containing protein [Bacteroidota bacterium]
MVGINNLTIHFTGDNLFENVSFIINPKDRIGLVGRNGAGKTTLLRIIAGLIDPHEGTISKPQYLTMGFLQQEMALGSKKTVFEETLTAFAEAMHLEEEISRLTAEISDRTDYESDAYTKLLNRLHDANERHHLIGGQSKEAEAEKVLLGLGFEPEQFGKALNQFSGGWQMRVELAKILLQSPDLLLLDEPTNHLDIESIQWLESFMEDFPGAVVLVSHDRAFLDNVTKRTLEISFAKIFDYKFPYSEYLVKREEERSQQMAAYNNQQREIAQIERFIERFRSKNTKSSQVQSRIKLLDKMEKVEVENVDGSAIHFQFPPAPSSGKVVVETHGLGKTYGDNLVLKDINISILKNDFVAFVGKNGMGKTTLSRIIVGDLEHNGKIKLGHNVKLGYFAQNQAEMLDPNKTVFQTIDEVAVGDIRPKIRNILGSFLFSGDTIDKKVKVLSGGEKSRLALARLLLTPVNLLILDEPTNHLDMQSKDILKNALLQFDGTLILVSHDRDFLQGLSNKVFEFRNHKIREYLGDIYDFLETRKLQTLSQLEAKNKIVAKVVDSSSAGKLEYEKRKQKGKDQKKISNQIVKCEEEIICIETQIADMDAMMADPEKFHKMIDHAKVFDQYQLLNDKLKDEMQVWEDLHLQLEAFNEEDQ